jgi:hypothetical protein
MGKRFRPKDYRQKASDLHWEREYALGEKVTFEKAFPTIEDVQVQVEEEGYLYGFRQGKSTPKRYSPPNMGEYIDCSNPLCYKGGFSIGSILREMAKEKKTDLETSRTCQGYEGSPKGRRKYRECINHFDIKVHIKYKKEEKEGG